MKQDLKVKPAGKPGIVKGDHADKGNRVVVRVHHCTRCGCDKSPLVNVVKGDSKSSYVCRFKNRCRQRQQRRWKR